MSKPTAIQDLLARTRRIMAERVRAERDEALKRRLCEDPCALTCAPDRRPRAVVWELTLRCNMRCAHCGSAAGDRRGEELTHEEAMALCDDLAELGCEILTLLGGEPFLREDWEDIAARLQRGGVRVNVISNGWMLGDERFVERVAGAGLVNVGLSIDGLAETHDEIRRRPGSFARIERAIGLLRQNDIHVGAVTVVHAACLEDLQGLYEFLIDREVVLWQLQIAIPRGRLGREDPWILDPDAMIRLADFVVARQAERKIRIDIADNIGYFGPWEETGYRATPSSDVSFWHGCMAGVRVLGVDANGDIKGCLSLPSIPEFIEGNVRERPLREIWEDPDAFAYNRRFKLDDLQGFCRTCEHAAICRAGCTSAAFGYTETVGETPYCLHRLWLEREGQGSG